MRALVIGTRGSALALWQAHHVQSALEERGISVRLRAITTTGDRRLDLPLADIGEKALFTKELDEALLDGTIDLAVHSLKDLPSELPEGIKIAAVTERTVPWDVFVAGPGHDGALAEIRAGAVIATSALRRQAQLKAWRADLQIVPVRGNVDTRLRKLQESNWDGMVLAEAGLRRLGLNHHIRERIPSHVMLPAVGQGSLAVVCASAADKLAQELHEILHDEKAGLAADAERSFLRRLHGGCSIPAAGYATSSGTKLSIEGCVASVDGTRLIRRVQEGDSSDAERLGALLATRILSEGGAEVLAGVLER